MRSIVLCLMFFAILGTSTQASDNSTKEEIKKVIQTAYVDGIQNCGPTEDIKKGFHPEFNLMYVRNEVLNKILIADWIKRVEQKKADNPNFPDASQKATVKFLNVEVHGGSSSVMFELSRGGKPVFIDFMFLLKFGEDWKIVSKISHHLPQ